MTDNELHRAMVRRRVESAMTQGFSTFQEILSRSEGADPVLIAECIAEVRATGAPTALPTTSTREVFARLPASDPFRGQWWFSGTAIDYLVDRAVTISAGERVLCLGAPTVGYGLLDKGIAAVVLDVDPHVTDAFNSFAAGTARIYDVADELPAELAASFRVAIIDPPWYDEIMRAFINRALAALADDGELLCTLPQLLTRPATDKFRQLLVGELLDAGLEVLSLETGRLGYLVPRFEAAALAWLPDFAGTPWRSADLLHVRKRVAARVLPGAPIAKAAVTTFARNPHEFRVFLSTRESLDKSVVLEPLEAYSRNISTRATDELPDLWTTEKVGVRIGQLDAVSAVLATWADVTIRSPQEALLRLTPKLGRDVAKNVVAALDERLRLWADFAAIPPLRTEEDIDAAKRTSLSEWATKPSPREHGIDGEIFRGPYQRDRDRVLWSGGLRRLADKTQLFPTEHHDELRRRLTHSVEVMQLASTIGASFGLDRDLIEAGSLAHDIGHTPFGHAGEHALDRLFHGLNSRLGGFNHYEHGVDVVRWLEGPYYVSGTTAFHGLNLTPEVAECILKHTYCQGGHRLCADEILAESKHVKIIRSGYCHLEGQAVRAADKISYLVSDLEDGIRLGAITAEDLLACRFFHRAPLSFTLAPGEKLYQRFIEQRRIVLKLLMEDILVATNKRLARMKPADVPSAGRYTVDHSEETRADMSEIWERLQVDKLHQDRRVKLANIKAARIVSELAIAFAASPELVDRDFGIEHERLWSSAYIRFYRDRVGERVTIPAALVDFLPLERTIGFKREPGQPLEVPTETMVLAKDYVAGLTDSRARALHAEMFAR